jgi:D-alanyl-D-alanine carboxypeptidase
MILRRAGLGLLVGAILSAPSVATAGPALVFEPYNGTVFYAEDPDAMWFPASLTKLMTAYVVFQALKDGTVKPDTQLVCSKLATQQAPSKLWLKEGESIPLDVGLKVLIVRSANDVAVMLAETVAGSQEAFVAKMNEAAQHLGMTRTHFVNVNGLPAEGQYTTARDLARLARAIIVEFPDHLDLFTTTEIQVGKQIIRTHNGLLVSLPGADGMKTGFICESGFNIVASATRDGRKLVAVVLGEQSPATRRARATDLLENGFQRYFWKSLFGTSLDGLAIQASLSDTPAHIADSICGGKVAKVSRKKYGTKPSPTLDLDAEEAVNASTDAAAAVAKGAVKATTGAAAAVAKGAVKATKKTLRKSKTVATGANN